MNLITILLAEDQRIIRDVMRSLLDAETDIQVVGEADNGRQAVALASKLCPDVIVMDISMPLLSGIEATRQILQTSPSTKVLVFSSYNDDVYIEQAMAFGASGYLVKQTDTLALPAAIRSAHQGRPFICPSKPTLLASL